MLYVLFKFFWYLFNRKSIAFATTLIKGITVYADYPVALVVGGIGTLLQVMVVPRLILQFLISLLFLGAVYQFSNGGIMFFVVFMFFWTSEVIRNVTHVAVTEIIGDW